ncbi:MAG TPA: L,D-transpeptidase family protein [Usitatibacter sp.]|nr:L,D-transpeptidase family protein [Usitatibacter sp.]
MQRSRLRRGFRVSQGIVLASFCLSAAALGGGSLNTSPAFANEVEGSLVRAIVGLRESGLKQAMGEIDRALERNPNFRLGHMVKGDMLMARAGKPVAFASLDAAPGSVAHLQDEARVRLQRYLDAPRVEQIPAPVLQLAPSQPHVIVIDTSRNRLYVFANDGGRPRYVTDFYTSLGKNGVEKQRQGDQKTPLGVYRVVDARSKLPDFYGPGAYPLDYPNEWDKLHGRNGHGIWLHGTPSETYSRPPWATDGCIVLTNEDFKKLGRYVDVNRTPVVIGSAVEWLDGKAWEGERAQFLAAFQRWKTDWESRSLDKYFSHYSPSFRSETRDLASWKAQKRKVGAGKQWIKVGVNDLSLFSYPGAGDTMMVTFEQDYRSNNLSNKVRKRQFWVRDGREWRIVHEAVI